jgi:hypothetical protein
MSTVEYPDLFSSGDGAHSRQLTACVNFSFNPRHGYIEGYKRAAEMLISHVRVEKRDQDYLVYPIIFMYRQHLELQLKSIILHARNLLQKTETGHPTHHKLDFLWSLAKDLARQVWTDHDDPPEFAVADLFIEQFLFVDPGSMAFRYPYLKDGSPSLKGITHINLGLLQQCMDQIVPFLDGVACGVEGMLNEMERYSDDFR